MSRAHDSSEWTVDQLQRAMIRETRIFEAGHRTFNSTMQDRLPTASLFTSAGKSRSSQRSQDHKSKQPVCIYCKGSHSSTSCEVHKDQPSRIASSKRNSASTVLHIIVFHRRCNGKHHTSICSSLSSSSVPFNNSGTTSDQSQSTSNSTISTDTTASLTTFVPSQLTKNTVCLLKTAIATVGNGSILDEAHILFDEGSQRSFFTEKLANLLKVAPHSFEHISLISFGSTQPLLRRYGNIIINLKTSKGDLMPISALVVSHIAAPLNSAIRTNMPYLKRLPLAHPGPMLRILRYPYLLELTFIGTLLATI